MTNRKPPGLISIVSPAIEYVSTNSVPLLGLLGQYLVVVLVAGLLAPELIRPNERGTVIQLITVIGAAPISIAIYRGIILQDPIKPSIYFPEFLLSRTWKFIGYEILLPFIVAMGAVLGVFMVAAVGGSVTTEDLNPLIILMPIIGVIVAGVFVFRFIFLFPAIAADQFESRRQCYRLMSGLRWQTFGALLVFAVPYIVMMAFLADSDSAIAHIGILVINLLFTAIVSAVVSISYVHARHLASL